ncbi:UNVERIFIED_CONTAM: DNA cytosine methyltransferase [Pseudomonas aeruginosa]|uniref:DNA cytosine methyltransferase n=1 Tax=Pseudomonas aeruginosa TaxID=287 RepID=UPI002495FC5E|nr:DNA cytosine methyltransferase [Pseudomonas aeruginosa]MDI2538010.1 DNA cytosine methyltransferase [Pseudomonas aeruginosa]HDQ4767741.1 DNA cytosine methyltransferase [Pseudomonas aeruginosa]
MNELALFAGAGGGILGGNLLGWRTVCAVEFEPYAASVLAARQNDGILPPFPIWDDVRTFDGRPWRGLVDVVSGGFPCQDISAAGNGAGIDGERSGLWREMARIVGEVRPRFVFVENSPLLVRRGLAVVLGHLTELGYDARWCVMGAADVGAPHQRDRIWIVANASGRRRSEPSGRQVEQPRRTEAECSGEALAETCQKGLPWTWSQPTRENWQQGWRVPSASRRWPAEPGMGRVADGVANRVDRIKALGNGQVPRVASTAFSYLASDWI